MQQWPQINRKRCLSTSRWTRKACPWTASFTFLCNPDLSCFNQCCHTPTVILSPYDLLRLKQGLGISSTALRQRYTRQEIEPNSNLPLVFIDAFRSPEGGCPFLGEHGCTVYPHRPAACRLFPITMGSRLTPDGVEDHYFCRRLDYCQGFKAEARMDRGLLDGRPGIYRI